MDFATLLHLVERARNRGRLPRGEPVFDGVDLLVEPGETVGLAGPRSTLRRGPAGHRLLAISHDDELLDVWVDRVQHW
jgi:hypothetical protein